MRFRSRFFWYTTSQQYWPTRLCNGVVVFTVRYENFVHFPSWGIGTVSIFVWKGCILLTYSMEQSPSWEADQSSQLTKKFPAFYGTWRFYTVLTSARHPSLSWAKSIQSPRPPPASWTSMLILSSHLRLGLPNGLFPSGFPTNTLYLP
jgi:hypothetical protein